MGGDKEREREMGKSCGRGERKRGQRQTSRMMRSEGKIVCNVTVCQNQRGQVEISHLTSMFFTSPRAKLKAVRQSPTVTERHHIRKSVPTLSVFFVEQVKLLLMFKCSYESSPSPHYL